MALITCKQYAEKNGISPTSVRHKCIRGGFKTAQKIGRDWLIDEDEPNVDHRIRSGAYIRRGADAETERPGKTE